MPKLADFKTENEARRSREFKIFLLGMRAALEQMPVATQVDGMISGDQQTLLFAEIMKSMNASAIQQIDHWLAEFEKDNSTFDYPNGPKIIALAADRFSDATLWSAE